MNAVHALVSCLFVTVFCASAQDPTDCTCQSGELDCSFRRKTVILDSERVDCSSYNSNWNLRGNYLRSIPNITIYNADISMNELGLGPAFSLDVENYLDVSHNHLSNITWFSSSCSLTVLNISNNAITKLEDDFPNIQKCKSLTHLRIANNKIEQIPGLLFSKMWYLSFLDLSGNRLSTLSNDTLNRSTLVHLDLSENRLTNLPSNVFSSSWNLEYIDISRNELAELSSEIFAPLDYLKTLILKGNGIQKLPLDIFDYNVRLRVLNLDGNLLEDLPPQLFQRLHSLQHLSARSNRLTALPSLRLCSGPLRTVMVSSNAIAGVDEEAARALWRPGFELADVRDNPVRNESLAWAEAALDITVTKKSGCSTLRLVIGQQGNINACATDD